MPWKKEGKKGKEKKKLGVQLDLEPRSGVMFKPVCSLYANWLLRQRCSLLLAAALQQGKLLVPWMPAALSLLSEFRCSSPVRSPAAPSYWGPVTTLCQCTLCSCSATDTLKTSVLGPSPDVPPPWQEEGRTSQPGLGGTSFVSLFWSACPESPLATQARLTFQLCNLVQALLPCSTTLCPPFFYSTLISTWYLSVHSWRLGLNIPCQESLSWFCETLLAILL